MLETNPDCIAPYAAVRDRLIDRLDLSKEKATEIIRVELGLRLWEYLNLVEQPATGVAALLTAQPFPSLQALSDDQRHALSVGLHLLEYGRHNWKAALREYMQYPAGVRMYRLAPDFMACRESDCTDERTQDLDAILHDRLELRNYTDTHVNSRFIAADEEQLQFKHPKLEHAVAVSIPPDLYAVAKKATADLTRLPPPGRPRTPIRVTRALLAAMARWLHSREADLGLPHEHWEQRLNETLRYLTYNAQTQAFGEVNTEDIVVDGLLHVAGIVSGGKSTLAKLLAVCGAQPHHTIEETVDDFFDSPESQQQWRTVLVVGDNTTALEWAHWFNLLLAPNRQSPVATVIFGNSNRSANLDKLARIGGLEHWGHRWLDPGCLLQGRVTSIEEVFEVLPLGREPCEEVEQRGAKGGWVGRVCPLWGLCPSRQMYRDIPNTRIWVTTMAAFMQSRLPAQLDGRRLYISELLYHYADLVIFDEIDHDQQWVDELYAPRAAVIDQRPGQPGKGGGLVPTLDRNNAGWMDTPQPTVTRQRLQWAGSLEGMLTHYVCTLLEEKPELQAFVSRMGYFTAPVLFSELAREVAIAVGGLDPQTEREDEQEAVYRPLADFLGEFHLHNHYLDPQENVDKQLEHELYAICYTMPAIPDTLWGGSYIHHQCGQWLQHAAAEFDLGPIPDQALGGLAWKLELSLTISLLTAYHYYTHSRSIDLPEGFGTLGTAPPPFLRVLPDAPLGVAYGFRYGGNNAEKAADAPTARPSPRRLESFRYEALGRMHLLNLPYLLAPLGYAGPNVLAMSGTSWIPHSAKHHFAATPGAILAPNATTEKALRASSFTFHPLYDSADNRKPVRISGSGNLERNMAHAIDLLALRPKPERSYLYRQVMGRLEDRAHSTPGWADRRRVLIFTNSYQQAKICAQHIGSAYTDWNVLYLQRGDTEDPTQSDTWASVFGTRPYPRARIETFGEDEEKALLFAPLLTIGRRYNILNSSRVAAFGAVIFMVRPMMPPNEQSGAIQWLNYRALELYAQPSHPVWQAATIEAQLNALRKLMLHEWFSVSMLRHGFGPGNNQDYNDETAATMIAAIIQACGRLLRGGVPFDAYFIDAAWAPKTAAGTGPDTAQTSLLVRMNQLLQEYVQAPLGQKLFAAFQEPFATMCAYLTQPQSLWEDATETELETEEDLDA